MKFQSQRPVLIGNRKVGFGYEPYIVAEVGINHNGDLDRAIEMIHLAKSAGCDAVKFQTFKAKEVCNNTDQTYTYKSQGKEITESMLEMFLRFELPSSAWSIIKMECEKINIQFFSTPQNISDLKILQEVGIPAIKVGSDDFTNLPLLRSYSNTNLPLILSSGMSNLSEAYQALDCIGGLDGYPVILLVCTSQYPTPTDDVNLSRISSLQSTFPNIPIGFSDHTRGPLASSVATGLGAVFLEKHFTLDHNLPGPDHWFSEDPKGLRKWVSGIRQTYSMLGSPIVRPTEAEKINKLEFQRFLIAACPIKIGEIFTSESFMARRISGGTGLPPSHIDLLIGQKSQRDYAKGDIIRL